ncbi:uncharacterized protein C8R40DRAFT_1126226 [Lentinula edodes]|uniref:uncharacterized protein n=1 Tax=Lentinula edodes TaxID=5353 RepID=UPI001E8EEAD3|nr:uncharacterized protein C8R40DRAFT_1126226 [Lentinula edodes]KAH7870547.1 hypothetical protein C8R40DRAFT_1126226 [Lentinula edodes]
MDKRENHIKEERSFVILPLPMAVLTWGVHFRSYGRPTALVQRNSVPKYEPRGSSKESNQNFQVKVKYELHTPNWTGRAGIERTSDAKNAWSSMTKGVELDGDSALPLSCSLEGQIIEKHEWWMTDMMITSIPNYPMPLCTQQRQAVITKSKQVNAKVLQELHSMCGSCLIEGRSWISADLYIGIQRETISLLLKNGSRFSNS